VPWNLRAESSLTSSARGRPRWDRITRSDDPEIYVRRVMMKTWTTWRRRRWRGEHSYPDALDARAPGDLAAEVTARLAVRQLLGTLTERQRTVVVLRIFDDLTEAQVAQILGCAVGTVKSTMSQRWPNCETNRNWLSCLVLAHVMYEV
jgi:RNA polymerase sigma factor (sigma-70 family)